MTLSLMTLFDVQDPLWAWESIPNSKDPCAILIHPGPLSSVERCAWEFRNGDKSRRETTGYRQQLCLIRNACLPRVEGRTTYMRYASSIQSCQIRTWEVNQLNRGWEPSIGNCHSKLSCFKQHICTNIGLCKYALFMQGVCRYPFRKGETLLQGEDF